MAVASQEDFFTLFRKQGELVRVSCDQLHEMMNSFDRLEERAKQMKDVEHQGDLVTHERCSASALGIPVSTTHTIAGSIIGAGVSASQRLSAVKWCVAGRILWAWVLTMPAAGIVAAFVLVRDEADGREVAATRPARTRRRR